MLFHYALLVSVSFIFSFGKQMSIKIVEEPSSYVWNNAQGNQPIAQQSHRSSASLKPLTAPSNFSGPHSLRQLLGQCFSLVDNGYRYELCPFANVTQTEQSLRWNPYSGVLGIWREWEISNNTFTAMIMSHGESCGTIHRSVRVSVQCAADTTLMHVSEPSTCHYAMTLTSPLVCHPDSMLVYPTLSDDLQLTWDLIEGRRANGELTLQGYEQAVRQQVLEVAGYVVSEKAWQGRLTPATLAESPPEGPANFTSVEQCSRQYDLLLTQLHALHALLHVNGISYDQQQIPLPAANVTHLITNSTTQPPRPQT